MQTGTGEEQYDNFGISRTCTIKKVRVIIASNPSGGSSRKTIIKILGTWAGRRSTKSWNDQETVCSCQVTKKRMDVAVNGTGPPQLIPAEASSILSTQTRPAHADETVLHDTIISKTMRSTKMSVIKWNDKKNQITILCQISRPIIRQLLFFRHHNKRNKCMRIYANDNITIVGPWTVDRLQCFDWDRLQTSPINTCWQGQGM